MLVCAFVVRKSPMTCFLTSRPIWERSKMGTPIEELDISLGSALFVTFKSTLSNINKSLISTCMVKSLHCVPKWYNPKGLLVIVTRQNRFQKDCNTYINFILNNLLPDLIFSHAFGSKLRHNWVIGMVS